MFIYIDTYIYAYIVRTYVHTTYKLNLPQNFTAIVTGHGKTKEYLHRFNP